MWTHIHAPSGIRTRDSSVRAVEDSTCLRPRSHWDRCFSELCPLNKQLLILIIFSTIRMDEKNKLQYVNILMSCLIVKHPSPCTKGNENLLH